MSKKNGLICGVRADIPSDLGSEEDKYISEVLAVIKSAYRSQCANPLLDYDIGEDGKKGMNRLKVYATDESGNRLDHKKVSDRLNGEYNIGLFKVKKRDRYFGVGGY